MNEKDLEKSEIGWVKMETMIDEEIDTSDIPPLDEKFFANARLRLPKIKSKNKISLDTKQKSS